MAIGNTNFKCCNIEQNIDKEATETDQKAAIMKEKSRTKQPEAEFITGFYTKKDLDYFFVNKKEMYRVLLSFLKTKGVNN